MNKLFSNSNRIEIEHPDHFPKETQYSDWNLKILPMRQSLLYGYDCLIVAINRIKDPSDIKTELTRIAESIASFVLNKNTDRSVLEAHWKRAIKIALDNEEGKVTYWSARTIRSIMDASFAYLANNHYGVGDAIGWAATNAARAYDCINMSKSYSIKEIMDLYEETYPVYNTIPEHYKNQNTIGIAKEIVETRNFSLMSILADAIVDTECPQWYEFKLRNTKVNGLSNWTLYNLAIGD